MAGETVSRQSNGRDRLRTRLLEAEADALLVLSLSNIRYLTGFNGSSAVLAMGSSGDDLLITDQRYAAQASREVEGSVEVSVSGDGLFSTMCKWLVENGIERVVVEGAHMTVSQWARWDESNGPELVPVEGWVETLRAIKGPDEVDAMQRAAWIADTAFEGTLESIREGMTEIDLRGEIDYRLSRLGAERVAFETIVAFGTRTALPHAKPSSRELQPGDLILCDLGASVDGYCSDLTRTVAFGPPGEQLRSVYEIVLSAQYRALEGLEAGLSGREADALARQPIAGAGYGERFSHSLGHGLGLDLHERPRLSRASEEKLEMGMVVTVEPGIYIEGLGGVRIEDDVLIVPDGVETLTRSNKDPLIIL